MALDHDGLGAFGDCCLFAAIKKKRRHRRLFHHTKLIRFTPPDNYNLAYKQIRNIQIVFETFCTF